MLEIRDMSISYGAIKAVTGVSLAARPGCLTALIGANGAGKSSIIQAIAGTVQIASGRIYLDGNDVTSMPAHKRSRLGLAVAMEGRRLFHDHTVEENLIVAWSFRNAKGDFRRELELIYETFPILGERRRFRAGSLSGGQQQMLILSMATIHKPRYLLLDEPSLGLAPIIVSQIFQYVKDYCAESGCCVLLSEQMASLALKVSDFGYVLRHGEVVTEGSNTELKDSGLASAYLGGKQELING